MAAIPTLTSTYKHKLQTNPILELEPPMMTQRQIIKLSGSDVRRIAANVDNNRHKERVMQLHYSLDRGVKLGVLPAKYSMMPAVSDEDINDVIECWTYFLKNREAESLQLATALLDVYSRTKAAHDKRRGGYDYEFKPFVFYKKHLSRTGSKLIDNGMFLLQNIRNNTALEEVISTIFDALHNIGTGRTALKEFRLAFMRYLSETLGPQWSDQLARSWTRILDGVMVLGVDYWLDTHGRVFH